MRLAADFLALLSFMGGLLIPFFDFVQFLLQEEDKSLIKGRKVSDELENNFNKVHIN